MSSVEHLREFVNERLTVAAEEIFGVFAKTIVEYEKEIDRQRKLLDIVWKPEIKLLRIELPQQLVCEEEEDLADQQLCIQERSSSLDQEDPEPPQIKEEQEELCTSQEGEQLVVEQETPTYEESDHSEDQTPNLRIYESQNTVEEKLTSVESSMVSEQNPDHQFLFHSSYESQNQKGGKHGDSGSTRNIEPQQQRRDHKNTNNVHNHTMSVTRCSVQTVKTFFKCDTCEKVFSSKCNLKRHIRIHTGEKPYLCRTCRKRFNDMSSFKRHTRIHTGEKPFSCNTCGKKCSRRSDLIRHIRIHSGDQPYLCKTWKRFQIQQQLEGPHGNSHK